jgi:hypothetical protein
MAITVEELTSRLNAEAERRGVTLERLLDEIATQLPDPVSVGVTNDRPVRRRLAFAGIGASTSGLHARDIDQALAEGFGRD